MPAKRTPKPPVSGGDLPPAVLERVADRFKMLGDMTRLTLINALHAEGELCVGDLVERLDISYGAVSKQLALLRSHGLVAKRRDGTRIYYRISDPSLSDLCDTVCKNVREDWDRWGRNLEQDLTR